MLLGVPSPDEAGGPPLRLVLNSIITYIYCCCAGYPVPPCISAGITHVAPIVLINALIFLVPAEPVVVVHLLVVAAGCSPNVTNIMVSAPACQKCFIFPMDFNNFHFSPISLILHRSARCMNPMLSRTCRFGVVKNATYPQ